MKTELTITIEGLSKKNTKLFVDWIVGQAEEWFVQDGDNGEFDWDYKVKEIDE